MLFLLLSLLYAVHGVQAHCLPPEEIPQGSVNYTSSAQNSTAVYTCHTGYMITAGDAIRYCTELKWTGTAPTCSDKNECALANSCDTNANCVNTNGSYTCTCTSGYSGNGFTCADVNECSQNTDNCNVNAVCTNTPGSFTCTCKQGYAGDGVSCSDVDECSQNTNNCNVNAVCTNTPGSFTCTCKQGYVGNGVSCSDVNECSQNTNNCNVNAVCTNTPGSFTCTCKQGYVGNGVSCSDVDECSQNTNNCNVNAVCTNTPGSFTCTCKQGYAGAGPSCSDINECAQANSCDTNANCVNTVGSYTCTCKSGYSGNGSTCADVNECSQNTPSCDVNAVCTNTPGSFTCTCKNGYAGNGVSCSDVDECSQNTHNCDVNAVCTNTPGSFTCTCKNGYAGNGVSCSVQCPQPPAVVNGYRSYATPLMVGTPATYYCNVGFIMSSGDVPRYCQLDGTWSGNPAICKVANCPTPQSIAYGRFTNKKSSVDYSCFLGYVMTSGDATHYCQPNDIWSGNLPICTDMDDLFSFTCNSYGTITAINPDPTTLVFAWAQNSNGNCSSQWSPNKSNLTISDCAKDSTVYLVFSPYQEIIPVVIKDNVKFYNITCVDISEEGVHRTVTDKTWAKMVLSTEKEETQKPLITIDSDLEGIKMTTLNPNATTLPYDPSAPTTKAPLPTVYVNQKLRWRIYTYENYIVKALNCTAFSGPIDSFGNVLSIQLIENMCSLDLRLVSDFNEFPPAKHIAYADLNVFRFAGSDELDIVCLVKACPPGSTKCDYDCSSIEKRETMTYYIWSWIETDGTSIERPVRSVESEEPGYNVALVKSPTPTQPEEYSDDTISKEVRLKLRVSGPATIGLEFLQYLYSLSGASRSGLSVCWPVMLLLMMLCACLQ